MTKKNVIALLARDVGLKVLEHALIKHPELNIVKVITHQKLPKLEGGGERPEAKEYMTLCQQHNIDLLFLDFPKARHPENFLDKNGDYDLLLSLSWRFMLSVELLSYFKLAAINIHRGALPKYKGAEPVRQAIEAGERQIEITAHHLVEELDAGPVISRVSMDIDPCPPSLTSAEYAEIIKKKLYPLYVPLTIQTIDSIVLS